MLFETVTNLNNIPNKTLQDSLYTLLKDLYPICRSITGKGLRQSLKTLQEYIPLKIHEIPSGTKVFDWTIPKEWNIREAWIKDSKGKKIIDFKNCNLHVLNYSIPVNRKISFQNLKEHLYTIPEQPDLIPYRTSYYKEQWGFCLSHNQLKNFHDDDYHVYIDSSLEAGSLSYGEVLIEGNTKDEVLVSTHICHPSLCNDNLSGVTVATHLAEWLQDKELHYSYRFLFIPGTIGSIAWLALNEDNIKIKHGLVLSCLGDSGNLTYKQSRRGNAEIDKIVGYVLSQLTDTTEIREFAPYGYDERQFCSPAFDLPVGCLMRTPYGEFPEYHTSGDNLDLVKSDALADSLQKLKTIIRVLENNGTYLNQNPKCEPNLGKRGLYRLIGGEANNGTDLKALLWILSLADGINTLLDTANRSGLSFKSIRKGADMLEKAQLIESITTK